MKKLIVLLTVVLLLMGGIVQASPLTDFSQGRVAVDLMWQPHTFEGTYAFAGSATVGLGGNWAIGYRQLGYEVSTPAGDWRTRNQEINLIHKLREDIQLYAGYARTTGSGLHGSRGLDTKKVLQAGAILSKKLGDRTVAYAILGGGANLTNIEFGLSWQMEPGLELTATYRHLTVEKVGPVGAKENFRGFGAGLTWKI
jgi:hypothetical protein